VPTINKSEQNSREALGNTKEIMELVKNVLKQLKDKPDDENVSSNDEDFGIKEKGKRMKYKQHWYHVRPLYYFILTSPL